MSAMLETMNDIFLNPKHIQGSEEWLAERREHIGASDVAAILGVCPWNTAFQIWEQKLNLVPPLVQNYAMKRGHELEPIARAEFERTSGFEVFPQCVYHKEHDFMMASLDGLSVDGTVAVEIKCVGHASHLEAIEGNVPKHYMPQLQHQLACCGLDSMWYYSFDGKEGVAILVKRDDKYIKTMIAKEKKFWNLVLTKTPPPLSDRDYVEKDSELWKNAADRLSIIDASLESLTEEREVLRQSLIEDAGEHSSRGFGISLGKTFSGGRIDYKAIATLSKIDMAPFRSEKKAGWTLRTKKAVRNDF